MPVDAPSEWISSAKRVAGNLSNIEATRETGAERSDNKVWKRKFGWLYDEESNPQNAVGANTVVVRVRSGEAVVELLAVERTLTMYGNIY